MNNQIVSTVTIQIHIADDKINNIVEFDKTLVRCMFEHVTFCFP